MRTTRCCRSRRPTRGGQRRRGRQAAGPTTRRRRAARRRPAARPSTATGTLRPARRGPARPRLRSRGAQRRDRPPRPRAAGISRAIRAAWPATLASPVAVVVLRDFRGRPKHVVDRLAEPLLGAAANQLAADDEHEDAWHEREPEQREDEFGPEPRKRQSPAALHHELDDVAREDEDERDEHRQVGGGERVENDLGQEIRVELGRAVGEADHRHECSDEHARCRRESGADCRGTAAARRAGPRAGRAASGESPRGWCSCGSWR